MFWLKTATEGAPNSPVEGAQYRNWLVPMEMEGTPAVASTFSPAMTP